jgi:hypothetical protein
MNIVVSNTEPKEEDRVDGMLWVSPSADWSCDGYRPPECPECPPVVPCPDDPLTPDQFHRRAGGNCTQIHYMGRNRGVVQLVCVTGAARNSFNVYYKDVLIASSGGDVYGTEVTPYVLEFTYVPDTDFTIRVEVGGVGNGDDWWYTVKGPRN